MINKKLINNLYSTDEIKTTDKWIDGKPIYRRIIKLNSSTTTNTYVNHGIENIDKIITSFITILDSGNYLTNWVRTDSNYCISVAFSPTRYFIYKSNNLTINDGWIIVEYTKTTD